MARETIEYIIPTDLDDIPDGTTYKRMSVTEQSKLSGIEEEATIDQTGEEIQGTLLALADPIRVLISSEPQSGQKKIYGLHVNTSGNLETDQDTTPEP